jgi:hypothetical protein
MAGPLSAQSPRDTLAPLSSGVRFLGFSPSRTVNRSDTLCVWRHSSLPGSHLRNTLQAFTRVLHPLPASHRRFGLHPCCQAAATPFRGAAQPIHRESIRCLKCRQSCRFEGAAIPVCGNSVRTASLLLPYLPHTVYRIREELSCCRGKCSEIHQFVKRKVRHGPEFFARERNSVTDVRQERGG